jgi:hypothetical protein
VLLILIAMVPVAGLWLVMARQPRGRWVVTGALAGITAAAGALVILRPRAIIELSLASLLLGAAAVVAGRWGERRRLGPAGGARAVVPGYLLGGWLVLGLCAVLLAARPGPFFPATDEVLPAPDGMRATVEPQDDRDCGSGSCQVTIEITGRPGQSGADLRAELTRHLEARGWDTPCRPAGWLIDVSSECVELTVTGGRATVRLTGNRGDAG